MHQGDSKRGKHCTCQRRNESSVSEHQAVNREVSHFFEKGYTTKKNQEGHGLGLYQANMIAQRYDGNITVELQECGDVQEISFRVEI